MIRFVNVVTLGVVLVLCNGNDDLDLHSTVYKHGYYSVDNVLELNQNKEYILSFPNTSTQNPYRITAFSENSDLYYPALVVVRQEKHVQSWQIPMPVSSTLGLLNFRNTSRTLCYVNPLLANRRPVGRFVLLCISNIGNLSMAIVGILFYPSYTDFGTYLLGILMANALMHATFYVCMKLFNKERICMEACLYGFLAMLCWAFSAYFFLNGSTLWTVTPAESRQLNSNCVFMNFYDNHDLWHLLSAPGMFFIFMFLMHLDDDLAEVPRNQIKAF
ncbi:hypothetical protein Trydic_g18161 [Trypoxylus dichotomus]